jgi:HlyD family secretion protein
MRGPSLRVPLVAGLTTIALGFGGFFGWAFAARLDNAAVSQATVVVSSKRKTASHFEGGILKAILKNEGDAVAVGDPLLLLDDTRARSELQQLRAKRVGLQARLARLDAEQRGERALVFGEDVAGITTAITAAVIGAETRLFAARREVYEGKTAIQSRVIEQGQAEIEALDAQITATVRQRELIDGELRVLNDLWVKNYVKRTQVVDVQTRQSELAGKAGELAARRAKAEQAMAGAKLEILSIGLDRQNEVANDLQTTQLALSEVLDRTVAAEDVLKRLVVTAPQDGIVTNLRFRTIGGAIGAGEPIVDIVPGQETLLVEARVEPRDIDIVHVGADTQVRLTAFNSRLIPPLPARVTYVAADQSVDDKNGVAYFIVRSEITPAGLQAARTTLYPGMPAEIVIVNGHRRAIDYLVAPIAESFNRAFRED